jgi:hypothetical protein
VETPKIEIVKEISKAQVQAEMSGLVYLLEQIQKRVRDISFVFEIFLLMNFFRHHFLNEFLGFCKRIRNIGAEIFFRTARYFLT